MSVGIRTRTSADWRSRASSRSTGSGCSAGLRAAARLRSGSRLQGLEIDDYAGKLGDVHRSERAFLNDGVPAVGRSLKRKQSLCAQIDDPQLGHVVPRVERRLDVAIEAQRGVTEFYRKQCLVSRGVVIFIVVARGLAMTMSGCGSERSPNRSGN